MQKLVSKNPVLRFKLGRKIVKAQGGTYFEVTERPKINTSKGKEESLGMFNRIIHNGRLTWGLYDNNGNFIPITKSVTLNNGTILNTNGSKSSVSARNAVNNPKIIERGYIDSNGNKTLIGPDNKPIITNKSISKKVSKPRSGWSYGFDRSKEGIGDIATMLRKLKAEGYYADDENSRDDGKWGLSTENAYKRYLAKQKAMELPPEVKVPTVPSVSSPTITPEQSKLNKSVINVPTHLNALPKVLKENLGKNNNYNGLVNLIWGENDPNHILGGFSSDIKNMFSLYKTKLDWLDNLSAIEKALNISGRYRGTRGGDFGDLIRALATYNGIKDYEVDKFNNSLKHKSGGQLVSKNPIVRFKQGSSFGKAFREARAAGLKEFEWNGKKYHTRTKEEEETRKKQPSANKKVTVYTPSGKKETTLTDSTENKKPTYTPSDSIKNKKLFVPK